MRARPKAIQPKLAIGALTIGLMVGCSLAPTYERPPAPVPEEWTDGAQEGSSTDAAPDLDWQTFVVDHTLRDLVDLALENNRDLRQTLLNVEAARAQYRVQRAERLPNVSLDGTTTRQRVGESSVESTYQVGVGITAFELDLFGRGRNLSDTALQEYLATERGGHAARVSLVAEVIASYLTRDGAQRRQLIATQILQARQVSLGVMTTLRARGFANELDFQRAVGLAEQAKADMARIEREVRQASNGLSLLLGVPDAATHLPEFPSASAVLVQEIAPGTSSTLLLRRPDIQAAEHQLKARNASIGAARAAFFPRISLTGSFGRSSSDLSDLFGSGQRAWAFSPQITLPIFDGGANRANLDIAHVRKDIAVAAYELSIQTAFREVSDALAATDTLAREESFQRELARASDTALRLAEARYRSGVDGYLIYLDAQRSDRASQLALVEVQTQRQIAMSALFRVLGGGWWGELSSHRSLSDQ